MSFPNRNLKRSIGRPFGFVVLGIIIGLLIAFLTGCDAGTVATGPLAGPAPAPPPAGPPAAGPGEQEPGTPTSAGPTYYLQQTTRGDTLYVQQSGTVAVPGAGRVRDSLHVRIRSVQPDSKFGVMVGMEGATCDLNRLRIVGIGYTAENSPSFAHVQAGALAPADAFTSWFADACIDPAGERGRLIAFVYDLPRPTEREFYIIVEGIAPGKADVRVQFELLGWPGQSWRWSTRAIVDVVP